MTSILVVDDDARLRERLGRALAERKYRVLTAPDHATALSLARAESEIDRASSCVRTGSP